MLRPVAGVWPEQKVSLKKSRKNSLAATANKWPEYIILQKIPHYLWPEQVYFTAE